jgi:DNA-binding response OmpR family regulator
VLVVEDERDIAFPLVRTLEREGHDVAWVDNGRDVLDAVGQRVIDVVILDLSLPDMDGLDVCRALRESGYDGAILIVTARTGELDRVVGLDSGADDYLTKPFGVRELVARARALVRRPRAGGVADGPVEPIVAGPIRLDPARRQAHLDGRLLDLTPHEFDVLLLLAAKPGIVFTREKLLERVWTSDTHVTERSVDTLIKRLRQKLEADTSDPQLILTVWGSGYKFTDV